jgi:hypothetical protein
MIPLLCLLLQDGIEFQTDLDEALKKAKESKAAVLLYFSQPG